MAAPTHPRRLNRHVEARRRSGSLRSVQRPAPVHALPPRSAERPERSGITGWIEAALGASRDLDLGFLGRLDEEVARRMQRIPTHLNGYGYDPWGFNVDTARRALVACALFYRYYFRVETGGVEKLPSGRVLVIANHAGQIALDAAMIGTAAFLEGEPPRILRGMAEYWLPTVPFVNELMVRTGSVVGTAKNCIDLLRNEEAVIVFPEGVRGMNKLFSQRYRLQRFGHGFVRLALATSTPILPVAVVGSEEQAPAIANLKPLARLLGMPAFPITLTWPWLGPLGLIPFPVKYRIFFGDPLRLEGDADDDDEVIEKQVDVVKDAIQAMLDRGVRNRPGIFF